MHTTRWARRGPKRCGLTAVLLLTALLAGCRGGVYPVEGQVVWEDDSPAKELAGSHVVFDLPEKKTHARGIVGADGSFRLTTNKPDDGAPPGEYKVLIVEANRKPLGGPDSTALAPGVIDSRYASPTTSDLRATVQAGSNKITLKVRRAPRR